MSPATRYDSVVMPLRPVNIAIPAGASSASSRVRVKVVNGDTSLPAGLPGHAIRLVVEEGDCPPGIVTGAPDFVRTLAGVQDTVHVLGGKTAKATMVLTVQADAFGGSGSLDLARCTLRLRADSALSLNADPVPSNNVTILEVNVTGGSQGQSGMPHQTTLASVAPLKVRIQPGKASATRVVGVRLGNADAGDIAGHGVSLAVTDGDCPPGTIAAVDTDRALPGPQNLVLIAAGASKVANVTVRCDAEAFASPGKKAPARCTALLTAGGPSGDTNSANDSARLVIDVFDRNDW